MFDLRQLLFLNFFPNLCVRLICATSNFQGIWSNNSSYFFQTFYSRIFFGSINCQFNYTLTTRLNFLPCYLFQIFHAFWNTYKRISKHIMFNKKIVHTGNFCVSENAFKINDTGSNRRRTFLFFIIILCMP